MTAISAYSHCTNYIIFMTKILLASISDYWHIESHFFLSKKAWIDTLLNLERTERMPQSVWQGIHLPIILRFGKKALIVHCIFLTFEWWLPNNRCLTLLFFGCWCKTLLSGCLYNDFIWILKFWRSKDSLPLQDILA